MTGSLALVIYAVVWSAAPARSQELSLVKLEMRGPASDVDALIVRLLQRAYKMHADQLQQRLGVSVQLDRPFVLRIYRDPRLFPHVGQDANGFTTPISSSMSILVPSWTGEQVSLLALPMLEAQLVAHEAWHQVCDRAGLRNLPSWYAEGAAEDLADEILRQEGMQDVAKLQHLQLLYLAKKRGQLPSVEAVLRSDPSGWDNPDVDYYGITWALIALLRETKNPGFAKFERTIGQGVVDGSEVDPDEVTKHFLEMCGPAASLDEALRKFIQPQRFCWFAGDLSVSGNRWTLAGTGQGGAWVHDDSPSLDTLPAQLTVGIEIQATVGAEACIDVGEEHPEVRVCLNAKAHTVSIMTRDDVLCETHVELPTGKMLAVQVKLEKDRVAVSIEGKGQVDVRLPLELKPPLLLWFGQPEGIATYELPATTGKTR